MFIRGRAPNEIETMLFSMFEEVSWHGIIRKLKERVLVRENYVRIVFEGLVKALISQEEGFFANVNNSRVESR